MLAHLLGMGRGSNKKDKEDSTDISSARDTTAAEESAAATVGTSSLLGHSLTMFPISMS